MTGPPQDTTIPPSWHSVSVEEIVKFLDIKLQGLDDDNAEKRLRLYGLNKLSPPKKRSPLGRFFLQFHNILIYVLMAAGLTTAILGHFIDAGVVVGVVVINAIIGFVQEGKAEQALEAIRNILSQSAAVLRNGEKIQIPAEKLVPGDVVFLQSGDKVPADLRLFKSKELRIDEAPLTGESMPVDKNTEAARENSVLGDRRCMAYSGTLVTYGQGQGVVIATGDSTEIGRINKLLSKVPMLTTKLLLQMSEFGERLTLAIGTIAIITFIFGVLVRNYNFSEMFLATVGLAVAAIPEGLPAIVTITLAVGVQRMAKRHAIIRRLPAVESLGSITVICSDKTGTLTRNEMTVKNIATSDATLQVEGEGYGPEGAITTDSGQKIAANEDSILNKMAMVAAICNDSSLTQEQNIWQVQGDPTEGALLSLAAKIGIQFEDAQKTNHRIDTVPFESEHRFMATLHEHTDSSRQVFLKGAPEQIIDMCSQQTTTEGDKPLEADYWHSKIDEIASLGQRTLAIAWKEVEPGTNAISAQSVNAMGGFTLLGLVGIIDPPRSEAIDAVNKCRTAGIRVKMITGDHAATAKAIGIQMGIGDGHNVVSGEELSLMNDDELRIAVQKTDIFARVSPEHKLKLVQALQANGEVVAMTGDGVNDAPALKRADVGVAMGRKGTEVAKESSEMVLTDDNFASISRAVEEGRVVYSNIKKAITFILPTNGGEAGVIIAAIFSGRMLPITPVQILWVNMITAVTLALSLAFEPAEAKVMEKPPRPPSEPLLSAFLVWRIVFVSLIITVGTFGIFLWARLHEMPIDQARTIAVNTLVMFEIFYLFNTRYLKESVFSKEGLLGNPTAIIAVLVVLFFQMLFTYVGLFQRLFGSAAITLQHWIEIVLIASAVFVLVEGEKMLFKRWEKRKKFHSEPVVRQVQMNYPVTSRKKDTR